jgi:hypothetical protein
MLEAVEAVCIRRWLQVTWGCVGSKHVQLGVGWVCLGGYQWRSWYVCMVGCYPLFVCFGPPCVSLWEAALIYDPAHWARHICVSAVPGSVLPDSNCQLGFEIQP